jgi:hypothetical protein
LAFFRFLKYARFGIVSSHNSESRFPAHIRDEDGADPRGRGPSTRGSARRRVVLARRAGPRDAGLRLGGGLFAIRSARRARTCSRVDVAPAIVPMVPMLPMLLGPMGPMSPVIPTTPPIGVGQPGSGTVARSTATAAPRMPPRPPSFWDAPSRRRRVSPDSVCASGSNLNSTDNKAISYGPGPHKNDRSDSLPFSALLRFLGFF